MYCKTAKKQDEGTCIFSHYLLYFDQGNEVLPGKPNR